MKSNQDEEEKITISNIRDSFNLVLMGDSSVGKTSILERYCNNFFKTEKYKRKTIEIYKKFITFGDFSYQLKFWDSPNLMDNCNDSEVNMFHNCDGIIYVCSYDNADSLTHINTWYQFLTQYIDLSTKEMILLINKNDLKEEKEKTNEIQQNNQNNQNNNINEITPEMLLQFQQMQQQMINEYLLKNGK